MGARPTAKKSHSCLPGLLYELAITLAEVAAVEAVVLDVEAIVRLHRRDRATTRGLAVLTPDVTTSFSAVFRSLPNILLVLLLFLIESWDIDQRSPAALYQTTCTKPAAL
jgi:ABC-type arginine transport system permease subunit